MWVEGRQNSILLALKKIYDCFVYKDKDIILMVSIYGFIMLTNLAIFDDNSTF